METGKKFLIDRRILKNIVPKELWIKINRNFVRFRQQICLPINPKCDACPINKICPKDFLTLL